MALAARHVRLGGQWLEGGGASRADGGVMSGWLAVMRRPRPTWCEASAGSESPGYGRLVCQHAARILDAALPAWPGPARRPWLCSSAAWGPYDCPGAAMAAWTGAGYVRLVVAGPWAAARRPAVTVQWLRPLRGGLWSATGPVCLGNRCAPHPLSGAGVCVGRADPTLRRARYVRLLRGGVQTPSWRRCSAATSAAAGRAAAAAAGLCAATAHTSLAPQSLS